MERPPPSMKTFCNHVALTSLRDGADFARLLRVAGWLGMPASQGEAIVEALRQEASVPEGTAPDRVGIWERKPGETAFVRMPDTAAEWHLWANLDRIEPKRDKCRVVLIGESVARGYFYDPIFTPAKVLQSILERFIPNLEVVDLARTDLGFEVAELAESALLLEPDAVVVFSGNNLDLGRWAQANPCLIDSVLQEEGIAGAKRMAEAVLAGQVTQLARAVCAPYKAASVPLIWMAPEFNFDWRAPFPNAPHLAGSANREWIDEILRARRFLDAGRLEEATASAQRLLAIDGGVSTASLYALAECSRRSGDRTATKRYLARARDAVIWEPSGYAAPRTYGATRDVLREEVGSQGCVLVDLEQLFGEHLGDADAAPGRTLFLDYCHLAASGIRIAMAGAAAALLGKLQDLQTSWRELVDVAPSPSPEVEAYAAMLAAIHNAHAWQDVDALRYYCALAVNTSDAVVEPMKRFIEMQTRMGPAMMSRCADDITRVGSPQLQKYLFRNSMQLLDVHLIDCMADALAEHGSDVREWVTRLRIGERGLAQGEVDLLDYYYSSGSRLPQDTFWALEAPTRRNFYRAHWVESRFVFITEKERSVRLLLTCRLPQSAVSKQRVVLSMNDSPQAAFEVGTEWETWDVAIPSIVSKDGANWLTLRWPIPIFPGEKALDFMFAATDGAEPEFYPVFGEIFTFVAVDGEAMSE
jgi:hypothetical protein